MVVSLERGADLHTAKLIPLPLTVSCFCKIQIGFTFLVPPHPGSPGQRAIKRGCVCVCLFLLVIQLERAIKQLCVFFLLVNFLVTIALQNFQIFANITIRYEMLF